MLWFYNEIVHLILKLCILFFIFYKNFCIILPGIYSKPQMS
jgi:hypothetical protein